MLLRGNLNQGALRTATRSIASCAPTQEHGRDHSRVRHEGAPPVKAALYRPSFRRGRHRRDALMVPMLLRGNLNRGALRPATRSSASCVPTQEHGHDHSRVRREGAPPAKAALYRLSFRRGRHRRGALMVPMLLRGNLNQGALRPATRSIASCAPTQEHGRDHSRHEGAPPAKAALYRLPLPGFSFPRA